MVLDENENGEDNQEEIIFAPPTGESQSKKTVKTANRNPMSPESSSKSTKNKINLANAAKGQPLSGVRENHDDTAS